MWKLSYGRIASRPCKMFSPDGESYRLPHRQFLRKNYCDRSLRAGNRPNTGTKLRFSPWSHGTLLKSFSSPLLQFVFILYRWKSKRGFLFNFFIFNKCTDGTEQIWDRYVNIWVLQYPFLFIEEDMQFLLFCIFLFCITVFFSRDRKSSDM